MLVLRHSILTASSKALPSIPQLKKTRTRFQHTTFFISLPLISSFFYQQEGSTKFTSSAYNFAIVISKHSQMSKSLVKVTIFLFSILVQLTDSCRCNKTNSSSKRKLHHNRGKIQDAPRNNLECKQDRRNFKHIQNEMKNKN